MWFFLSLMAHGIFVRQRYNAIGFTSKQLDGGEKADADIILRKLWQHCFTNAAGMCGTHGVWPTQTAYEETDGNMISTVQIDVFSV